ncbi:MAG: nucleoside deaminase [Pyrinomonadaceae bacterium]
MSDKHEFFMRRAIELAKTGMEAGDGGPFGAVIVRAGEIVGEGWNRVTSTNDPTAHAEVNAIRDACRRIGSFQLDDCIIYSSCEPCPMCLGAIYWARPKMLLFAGGREDAAQVGFDDQYIYDEISLETAKRSIETLSILRSEAVRVFTLWREKEDKINY